MSHTAPPTAPTVAWAMLECDFCGCYTPKPGKGWVAYLGGGGEPARIDESGVVIYCPPCAAAFFGFRPDVAARYICIFDPPPSESDDDES